MLNSLEEDEGNNKNNRRNAPKDYMVVPLLSQATNAPKIKLLDYVICVFVVVSFFFSLLLVMMTSSLVVIGLMMMSFFLMNE